MTQQHSEFPDDQEDSDGSSGSSGSGDFGRPQLKPNLDTLFDPTSALSEGGDEGQGGGGGSSAPLRPVESFGEWDLHTDSLMLYHRRLKKRLMLEQLNTPSKMMKVVVALAMQSGWDTEHLIRGMDSAAMKRFGKPLYQIISMAQDTATLDWRQGMLKTDLGKPSFHS